MTLKDAKILYVYAGAEDSDDVMDWGDIRADMQAIIDAPGPRKAGQAIEYWGCWNDRDTATAFAKKVRAKWAEMNA